MPLLDRPNIVLFISDQQRADTMPGISYGQGARHTPHLDWLSRRGTMFRRAYCTTPMCSPARASLLSGLYPHAHGVVANHQERPVSQEMRLSSEVKLLADYLKPLGYACAYTGKWHLGTGGDRRGFDAFMTRSGDHDTSREEENEILQFTRKAGIEIGGKLQGLDSDPSRFDAKTKVGSSLLPLAFHPSARNARAAAGFISSMKDKEDPFCLVYSCHEPHPPFISPSPFDTMVSPSEVALPLNLKDPSAAAIMAGRPADWQLKSTAHYTEAELRAIRAAYAGAVSYVDHLAGIILEALLDTDQFNETLFIFTSDHGEMLGNHGMIYKGSAFFEELMKIPLLISPPGEEKKTGLSDALVSHVDLLPTILQWCGLKASQSLPGKNLRPLLEGSDESINTGIAFQYYAANWGEHPVPLRGWLTERWKYVEDIHGPVELYDLRNDLDEMKNRVSDPACKSLLAELRVEHKAWQSSNGDPWPNYPLPKSIVEMPPGGPWNQESS